MIDYHGMDGYSDNSGVGVLIHETQGVCLGLGYLVGIYHVREFHGWLVWGIWSGIMGLGYL